MLINSSWRKGHDRITILENDKLNYNGKVYEYVEMTGSGHISILEWKGGKIVVEKGKLSGWDEELPLFNPYHFSEWQRFLKMFFPHQYSGDGDIEIGELDNDVWREWKDHYLNENRCGLKSPRDRASLRLSRSPLSSPICSPSVSPRLSSRRSFSDIRGSPLRERSRSDQPLRLRSSPGRCQTPRTSPTGSSDDEQ